MKTYYIPKFKVGDRIVNGDSLGYIYTIGAIDLNSYHIERRHRGVCDDLGHHSIRKIDHIMRLATDEDIL